MLRAALDESARAPLEPWGETHRPRLTHPLSASFPEAAQWLNPPSLPIGGDGDTVMATGMAIAAGPAATYGALSRYVFDVGDWDASQWVVFHGVSGHPGSPHYADQNPAWSACLMVPMRYSWASVEAAARNVLRLEP